mgnify:CR=1 FL=1
MDIKRAKKEIKDSIEAYLAKDEFGDYMIPQIRQRPILLMGPPGIGKTQVMEQVAYYKRNAMVIYEGLKEAGYTVFGGINSPYIWLKVEDGMDSWEFFDYLLEQANVVGTPGSGFGPSGEGYFRLTAFGTYENTVEAVKRIKALRR